MLKKKKKISENVTDNSFPTSTRPFCDETMQEDQSPLMSQCDQQIQVDFSDDKTKNVFEFSTNFFHYEGRQEAQTQACIPVANTHSSLFHAVKKFKNKACGTVKKRFKDSAVGPDTPDPTNPLKCTSGFHGMSSVNEEQDLIDLAGVSRKFQLLLNIYTMAISTSNDITSLNKQKVTTQNRMLIFFTKMKTGLPYSTLAVMFCIHRTTISTIFFEILEVLAKACKHFVTWPSQAEVRLMMPPAFRETYPNCRVIIDCTEFHSHQPSTVENRVQLYSSYKKGFRVKILVGCTPNGLISFVSRCYGGRTTDAQLTTSCGILNLLEPGDMILADKGFPQIKTVLNESGKGVLLVMPPFLYDEQFTSEEVAETYKVAKFRIHIERIMQRIRTYHIMEKLNSNLLPFSDKIVFMVCVLVNLQPPILKEQPKNDAGTSV